MEGDDDSCGDEDSLRVQRTSASDVAGIERQLNSSDLTTVLIRSAALLIEESLDVDMSFEGIASVEVNSDGSWTTFDLRFAFDSVVNWNAVGEGSAKSEN